MARAAKHQPRGKKIAAALQEEFMRALELHYPTPRDPLYDVTVGIALVGDKFSVGVHPLQLENWDWDRSELFDRARENAQDVANSFQAELRVLDKTSLKLSEWVEKLNAYFVSKNAGAICNPLLTTKRGQAHA